jgi:hypothetical protein
LFRQKQISRFKSIQIILQSLPLEAKAFALLCLILIKTDQNSPMSTCTFFKAFKASYGIIIKFSIKLFQVSQPCEAAKFSQLLLLKHIASKHRICLYLERQLMSTTIDLGLLTKDVFRGGGLKKVVVCIGEKKTKEDKRSEPSKGGKRRGSDLFIQMMLRNRSCHLKNYT